MRNLPLSGKQRLVVLRILGEGRELPLKALWIAPGRA